MDHPFNAGGAFLGGRAAVRAAAYCLGALASATIVCAPVHADEGGGDLARLAQLACAGISTPFPHAAQEPLKFGDTTVQLGEGGWLIVRRNGAELGRIAAGAVDKDAFAKYSNCLSDIVRIVSGGDAAAPQEATWRKLTTASAEAIDRAPEFVQRALGPELTADRERWGSVKPPLDRNGKVLPGTHAYIPPTIAYGEIEAKEFNLGLSLSDAHCDGPNSADAPDLSICKAVLSMQRGDSFRTKNISVCFSGEGDEWANEIAYDKEKRALLYRVLSPDDSARNCAKSFELPD